MDRIILNTSAIDLEELRDANGTTSRRLVFYQLGEGKIQSMTIYREKMGSTSPQVIVDAQLLAYNQRDIEPLRPPMPRISRSMIF